MKVDNHPCYACAFHEVKEKNFSNKIKWQVVVCGLNHMPTHSVCGKFLSINHKHGFDRMPRDRALDD